MSKCFPFHKYILILLSELEKRFFKTLTTIDFGNNWRTSVKSYSKLLGKDLIGRNAVTVCSSLKVHR